MLAAVLHAAALLLTGDTGPMHLAAAVGTPVLAVFGPSMPWRYGPLVEPHRVVRVDLPCSPCNRIRLPPERCQGHTPDCLAEVHVEAVVAAGRSLGAAAPASADGRLGERAIEVWNGAAASERSTSTACSTPTTPSAPKRANQWIKDLRHARVDGASLRDRFTHRGDSLWWFAEIYLHRMRVVTRAHRAVAALERLARRGSLARWFVEGPMPSSATSARGGGAPRDRV